MSNQERILELLDKYTSSSISPEEHSELFSYISSGAYDDISSQHIQASLQNRTVAGANLPPHRSAEIIHKILLLEKQTSRLIPGQSAKITRMRWAVAAAILIGVMVTAGYFLDRRGGHPALNPAIAKNMDEKTNTSSQPEKMEMEDGSMITLQPGSKINYPFHFLPGKREVYLEGEAFFEVSKNPNSPFYVYSDNIVTHVLGTSFNVKRDRITRQVVVSVRTGKVEVYEGRLAGKSNEPKKDNGVILLPNQKVVYDDDKGRFVPSLVDTPLPIIAETEKRDSSKENFVFDEAALSKVLDVLGKNYGIEIVVENENIYHCLFTGDISRQGLYAQLDIICESVHASYEIKSTKILIKGKGCN
jgi:hypothetical protein